jgi:hypothetical protein
MKRNLVKNMLEIKFDLVHEIEKFLPAAAREPLDRLEYGLIKALNEASAEYLEKQDRPKYDQETVRKVVVE